MPKKKAVEPEEEGKFDEEKGFKGEEASKKAKTKKPRKTTSTVPDVDPKEFMDAMTKMGKDSNGKLLEITPSAIRQVLKGPSASMSYHVKLFATANKLAEEGKIEVYKREGKRTFFFRLAE